MNYAKKVTKKISDRATKFEQSNEDKNIFEDEIDELQKLAADNMALAELAAKWAADARRQTMQQKEVVAELRIAPAITNLQEVAKEMGKEDIKKWHIASVIQRRMKWNLKMSPLLL